MEKLWVVRQEIQGDIHLHEIKIPRNRSLLERVFVRMKIIR
jgi:hypothetical protein